MKPFWHNQKDRGFTLVELLVVIAIIGILAALLLPALSKGKARAQRVECISNLNEIGIGFQIFAHDHNGKFPMQIPIADGGSQEFVTAGENIGGPFYFSYQHLKTLATELTAPKILVCPADLDREPATSFGLLQNSNVSYFVAVDASYDAPQSVLAGDRNVTNDTHATPSLVQGISGLRWTREMHYLKGNILFSDTHVEEVNNNYLNVAGTPTTPILFLPTVPSGPAPPTLASGPPASTPPSSSPPSSGLPPAGNPPSSPTPPGSPLPPITSAPPPGSGPTPGSTVAQNPYPQSAPSGRSSYNSGGAAPSSAPSPASPMNNGMSSAGAGDDQPLGATTVVQAHARETNAIASSDTPQTAAPADDDEPEPPLLWLQGAAADFIGKNGGWLLLLLLLIIAVALYYYSRRKLRRQRRKA